MKKKTSFNRTDIFEATCFQIMFCTNKDVLSTLVVVFFFLFRFYHHEKLKDTALSLIKHFCVKN